MPSGRPAISTMRWVRTSLLPVTVRGPKRSCGPVSDGHAGVEAAGGMDGGDLLLAGRDAGIALSAPFGGRGAHGGADRLGARDLAGGEAVGDLGAGGEGDDLCLTEQELWPGGDGDDDGAEGAGRVERGDFRDLAAVGADRDGAAVAPLGVEAGEEASIVGAGGGDEIDRRCGILPLVEGGQGQGERRVLEDRSQGIVGVLRQHDLDGLRRGGGGKHRCGERHGKSFRCHPDVPLSAWALVSAAPRTTFGGVVWFRHYRRLSPRGSVTRQSRH